MRSLFAAALCVCFTAPVSAQDRSVPVGPGLPGWEPLIFDDKLPNRWFAVDGALAVESRGTVSFLFRTVDVDLGETPMLRWRWRVDEAPPPTDIFRRGGDDRALAVGIGYAYDSGSASMGEKVQRMVVEATRGSAAPGRVLSLVWGGSAPAGTRGPSPYPVGSGQVVILRGPEAPLGQWIEEEIDLAQLYRDFWGSTPPRVVSIDLSADSDDTQSSARARIADIRFGPR